MGRGLLGRILQDEDIGFLYYFGSICTARSLKPSPTLRTTKTLTSSPKPPPPPPPPPLPAPHLNPFS